jgi:hypothetical protein
MKPGLLEKIKSRGYWRINFQPNTFGDRRISLAECKDAVERNAVLLRGWDYPHVSKKNDEHGAQLPAGEYQENWVHWWNHIEFWRMYRSKQFLHYRAIHDDWFEQSEWAGEHEKQIKPGTSLGVVGTIYLVTEIFEFLSRLTRAGFYSDRISIDISIENTVGRELRVDSPARMPFLSPHKTGAESIKLHHDAEVDDLKVKSSDLALTTILEIFDQFGWSNPPVSNIKLDQQNLLAGRPRH